MGDAAKPRTPFSFLLNSPDDIVQIVHDTLLSDLRCDRKHQIINSALDEEAVGKYVAAMNKKKGLPPVEAVQQLPPDMNARLFNAIATDKLDEIPKVFEYLDAAARAEMEEWHREISDNEGYTIMVFREAKEQLQAFLKVKEEVSDRRNYSQAAPEATTFSAREEASAATGRGFLPRSGPTLSSYHEAQTTGIYDAQRAYGEMRVTNEHQQVPDDIPVVRANVLFHTTAPVDETYKSEDNKLTTPIPITRNLRSLPTSKLVQDFNIGDVAKENVFNILLLGETGVGKTTFINSLANYLRYNTLDETLHGSPLFLMDSSFTMTNNGLKQVTVKVKANSSNGMRNCVNEHFNEDGQSVTQDPLLHSITWNDKGTPKLLKLIDTPGINDTRGAEQDEANFDKILALISRVGHLNAICILLKPNESKLSVGFRNCFDNLLVKLHRSATKNILFCFTNTRSTLYRPGDTMAPLGAYLEELKREAQVTITPNKSNIFCFDNDCFRYMSAVLQLPKSRSRSNHKTFSASWEHNVQECSKLLQRIDGLIAHQVEDTVSINNTRRLLCAMARPLSEIGQNHLANRKMVEDKIEQIKLLEQKGQSLGALVEQTRLVVTKKDLKNPHTVCTSPQCNRMEKAEDGVFYPVPKQLCHDNCHLEKIEHGELKNPSLKICVAFRYHDGLCYRCKCSWTEHMHQTYEIVRKMETVVNREVQAQLHQCKSNKQQAELVLKDLENQLANINNEYSLITSCSMEFSAYLRFNSLKQDVDPYYDYLNHLLAIEERKSALSGYKKQYFELKTLLAGYQQGVEHILEEMQSGRRAPLTAQELRNKIDNLSRMKLSGQLIEEIAKAAEGSDEMDE